MDCFTLCVRSFEVLFSFSKLRGRRPRQSIPRLVYYRNHERSNVIHFTSSGIWTASHFVFAVSRSYFLFRNCEAAGRGNPFPVWYIIEITNEVTRSISRRLVYELLHTSCSQFRGLIFFSPSDTKDCFTFYVCSFKIMYLRAVKRRRGRKRKRFIFSFLPAFLRFQIIPTNQ